MLVVVNLGCSLNNVNFIDKCLYFPNKSLRAANNVFRGRTWPV